MSKTPGCKFIHTKRKLKQLTGKFEYCAPFSQKYKTKIKYASNG